MRRSIPLVLALLAPPQARAQVRAVTELAFPAAPTAAPISAVAPAFALPALGATLPAPSLSVAVPLAAPAPVAARTALIQTGSALSAAAEEKRDEAAVSRAAFDAAAPSPDAAGAVAGANGAAAPSAFEEPNSPQGRYDPPPPRTAKTAAVETAELALQTMVPVSFVSLLLREGIGLSNPAILIPAMIALWLCGAWGMRGQLGGLRSTVTGGWQASHDQKFRVDYNTGRLRDVRGHKYGSDRYEERTPGAVGPLAMGLIAAASAAAAAAFLLL